MPYTKIPLQELRLDSRYENLKKISGEEFKKIKKFIDMAKNGENGKGIDISKATERKYIDAFMMAYRNVEKKKLSDLDKTDLTNLKQGMKEGKLKSKINKPYTISSQREMELLLIRFLEFVNPKKYSGFRKWFVVRVPKNSVDYLKEEEIIKLYNACKTNEERYLICMLFDGGLRASEFLNVRFEDIQEPTQAFPYYKVDIKEEYSKTKGRNIGLYWKHSTDAIRDYLEGLDDSDPKAQVYPKNYDAVRKFLRRLGEKVLNKRIYFHIFRKSSATHYARIIKNRQQICYRYAWRFSSSMPDIYISRELGEEEVKEIVKNTSQEKLEKDNQELKTKHELLKGEFENLMQYLPFLKKIESNKKIIKMLSQ